MSQYSACERWMTGIPRSFAVTNSGFSGQIAPVWMTVSASPRFAASCPTCTRGAECGEVAQRLAVGAVGTRHADAALEEHAREARHAGAADADEVRGLDVLGDGKAQVGSDHDPSILSWATGCLGPGALGAGVREACSVQFRAGRSTTFASGQSVYHHVPAVAVHAAMSR